MLQWRHFWCSGVTKRRHLCGRNSGVRISPAWASHPPLGLVVRCGDLALSQKKHAFFVRFFHVQPKHQNGSSFVDIEGVRPCLSKLSYRAPKWALMVCLMQKERLESPQKSPILKNQAIWVILAILAKNGHFGHLASHFQTRVDAPKKSPSQGLA